MATSAKKSTAAAKTAAAKTSRAPVAPAKKPAGSAKKAAPPPKAVAKPAAAVAKPAAAVAKPAAAVAKPGVAAKPAKAAAAPATPTKKAAAAPKAAPAKTPAKGPEEKPSAPGTPEAATAAPGLAKPSAPRLTVRTPVGADELKQKIGALATATANIRNLKRSLQRSFYEIGLILKDIDDRKLYEVKGYGSFEAFVEREIDLGKQLGLRLARTVQVFHREAAVQAGLERVSAAIAVLDGEVDPSATPPPGAAPSSSGGARSPIPFHKQ